MNRRDFSKIAISAIPLMSFKDTTWSVQLWRHATLTIKVNGVTFLVDPMLSPKGSMDPVGNAGNDIRIPMVELPFAVEQKVKEADAVIVTHTHRDHWDTVAQQTIDKSKRIFCQAPDYEKIKSLGFTDVSTIQYNANFKGVNIQRIGGQHGTGEIGARMGTVSGFVFEFKTQKLYVAGDTIWCPEVEQALLIHRPKVVIVNAGGAQFLTGDPITMNESDVNLVSSVTDGTVVAVHMDTINHCKVTREILRKFVTEKKLTNVVIPADGETLDF